MTLRLHVGSPLAAGVELSLPEDAARHAQVRRVQPGDALVLFDGAGTEARAEVLAMGRREVRVRVLDTRAAPPAELPVAVTLAFGMPANERMDALVEKATELGAVVLQPLVTARSVLRLDGERAERRRAHWQAVAVAACEQCGRSVVPMVAPVRTLAAWLGAIAMRPEERRWLLSPAPDASPLPVADAIAAPGGIVLLSGPEGGLDAAECASAQAAGFAPVSLGPRVLRADTAPLAALAAVSVSMPPSPSMSMSPPPGAASSPSR